MGCNASSSSMPTDGAMGGDADPIQAPSHRVFISFHADEALGPALALKQVLQEKHAISCFVKTSSTTLEESVHALYHAEFVVILVTSKYGENGDDLYGEFECIMRRKNGDIDTNLAFACLIVQMCDKLPFLVNNRVEGRRRYTTTWYSYNPAKDNDRDVIIPESIVNKILFGVYNCNRPRGMPFIRDFFTIVTKFMSAVR